MLICRSSRRRFVTAHASTLPFGGTRTKTTPSRKLAWAESFGKILEYFAGPLLWHSPEVPRANIKYHSIQSDSVCMRLLLNIRGVEPSENKATYYWWWLLLLLLPLPLLLLRGARGRRRGIPSVVWWVPTVSEGWVSKWRRA